jgi:hypothetical protein
MRNRLHRTNGNPKIEPTGFINLPVAIFAILTKGGIPKIWGETLLLLLLGIDYFVILAEILFLKLEHTFVSALFGRNL